MKKIIIIGILVTFFASLRAQVQTLDDAVQNLRQKNYAAAVEVCNELLAKSSDPSVLSVRSQAYTAMGKYDLALQDADKALSVDNKSDRAHYAKAEALYGRKEYDKALTEYNAAVASNAQMSEAYAGKARAYMGLQNYKEAMKVTEDAMKTFPGEAELFFTHGLLNFQRGKPKSAVEDYDKALSLNPSRNLYQVYLNRGLANEALLEYDAAVKDFTNAIATDPNSSGAYLARGNVKYVLSKYSEAVEDFKKAEVFSPDNSVITYNIGMSYYRNEERSAACKYFQKSCSQGNNNACKMVILNCSDRKIN